MRHLIATCVCLLFAVCISQAQSNFYAHVDGTGVVEGSTIELEFILENANWKDFNPPDLSPFKVVSGPNSSTSMSFINGARSSRNSYSYYLLATKKGTFTIGPATTKWKGEVLQTEPITITVSEGKAIHSASAAKDLPEGEQLFIKVELSDSSAYVGQQIILDYVIYTRTNISSINLLDEDAYDGFYVELVRNLRNKNSRVVLGGVEYYRSIFKRLALFPQQRGEFVIPATLAQIGIPEEGNQRRSFFSTTRMRRVNRKTEPVTIQISDLPDNAPPSFTGAIGEYQMSARVQKQNLKADDALSLTISILGNGDPNVISAPPQQFDSFDMYDPNTLENTQQDNGVEFKSKKVFEYLGTPIKKGSETIIPEFTYFDVDSGAFVTLRDTFLINIANVGIAKIEKKEAKKDVQLAPLILNPSQSTHPHSLVGSKWQYFGFGFGLLSMLGILVYKKKKLEIEGMDPALIRSSNAYKNAVEKLDSVSESLSAKQKYEELGLLFRQYMFDRFGLQLSESSKETILKTLKEKGLDMESQEIVSSVFNRIEQSVYAGNLSEHTVTDNFSKVRRVLTEIEKLQ